jgi:5'-nucleotidase
MRILVANDDGIGRGLAAVVRECLERGHEVVVATTEGQRSASSKAVAFRTRYRVSELMGCPAVIVDSTPASAIAVALEVFEGCCEVVVSGVNEGPNLGLWDILSSGTVGAVLEGALRGLKGIAVSLVARRRSEYQLLPDGAFREAAQIALNVLEMLPSSWPVPALNLNVPAFGSKEVVPAQPERAFTSRVYQCSGGECAMREWVLEEDYPCVTPGSDVCLVKQGLSPLTPLPLLGGVELEWLSGALARQK